MTFFESLALSVAAAAAGGLVGGSMCMGLAFGLCAIFRTVWAAVLFVAAGKHTALAPEDYDWTVARIAAIIGFVGLGGLSFAVILKDRLKTAASNSGAEIALSGLSQQKI